MKNKIKNFISDVKNSFYNPGFYSKISEEKTFSQGLKFISILVFLVVLVFVIKLAVFSYLLIGGLSRSQVIQNYYPADLVIDIKNGHASTTSNKKFTLPFKDGSKNQFDNLLVIDTSTSTASDSVKALSDYKTALLLTKDNFLIKKSDLETQVISLRDVKDITINQQNLLTWSKNILRFFSVAIIPLALLGIIFGTFFSVLCYLITLLIFTFVTLLMTKIKGNSLEYKKAYVVSMYALCPILVINILLSFLSVPSIPFLMEVLIFALVVSVNFEKNK